MTFCGTKKYDVTATKGPRRHRPAYKKFTDPWLRTASTRRRRRASRSTSVRILKQAGKIVKTEKFTTHYRPEDDVTCTHPESK